MATLVAHSENSWGQRQEVVEIMQKIPDGIVDIKNPFDRRSVEDEERRPQAKREREIYEKVIPPAHDKQVSLIGAQEDVKIRALHIELSYGGSQTQDHQDINSIIDGDTLKGIRILRIPSLTM